MRRALLVCSLLVTSALSSCAAVDSTVIAVLAADESAQVQQPLDVEGLEEHVEEMCDGCTVEVYDAGSEADTQGTQFDQALVNADIVILDPVDPELAESLVQRTSEVPVIAYGTPVPGADWYVGLADPATAVDDVDSDLEAAREVILRDRDRFSYVPAAAMSSKAADVAVGELADEPVADPVDHEGVPSWLFDSTEVSVKDLTSVVVASGAMTLAELCSGSTAKRCAKLGLV
jgi:ABC-type xylose transport system substrate-binding protein